MDDEAHVALFEESIKASNRTTHAVRALTKFIVYEAAYTLAVVVLLGIALVPTFALEEPWWVLVFMAAVLAIAGLFHSFSSAFGELNASEVRWGVLPKSLRRSAPGVEETAMPSKKPAAEREASEIDAFEKRSRAERAKYERLYGITYD
jgi:hypothetical protein